jgi:hypothetical protein
VTSPLAALRIYSHTLMRRRQDGVVRWRFGYAAAPAVRPGRIRVSRAVAEQICRDLARLRAEVIAEARAGTEFYEDALTEVDATLPRLYLDGEHLVADWRHVDGNSDALRSTDRDPDGWYTITLGLHWHQVEASDCDTVRDDSTWLSPTAAYEAFVGCFSDPTVALLDLASRAGIAVAYLDRGAIEADSRPLTDDEWDRITYHLADYDQHVSGNGDLNAAFLDHLFVAAGLERDAEDGAEDHDAGSTGH